MAGLTTDELKVKIERLRGLASENLVLFEGELKTLAADMSSVMVSTNAALMSELYCELMMQRNAAIREILLTRPSPSLINIAKQLNQALVAMSKTFPTITSARVQNQKTHIISKEIETRIFNDLIEKIKLIDIGYEKESEVEDPSEAGTSEAHIKRAMKIAMEDKTTSDALNADLDRFAELATVHFDIILSHSKIDVEKMAEVEKPETKLSANNNELFQTPENLLSHIAEEAGARDTYFSAALKDVTQIVLQVLNSQAINKPEYQLDDATFDALFKQFIENRFRLEIRKRMSESMISKGIEHITNARQSLQANTGKISAEDLAKFAQDILYLKDNIEDRLKEISDIVCPGEKIPLIEGIVFPTPEEIDSLELSQKAKDSLRSLLDSIQYTTQQTHLLYAKLQSDVSLMFTKMFKGQLKPKELEALNKTILDLSILKNSRIGPENEVVITRSMEELVEEINLRIEMAGQPNQSLSDVNKLMQDVSMFLEIARKISTIIGSKITLNGADELIKRLNIEIDALLTSPKISPAAMRQLVNIILNLKASQLISSVQYQNLTASFSDKIIKSGKVVEAQRILKQFDTKDAFDVLTDYSNRVIGASVEITIGENEKPDEMYHNITHALQDGMRTNLTIRLPLDNSAKVAALEKITQAMKEYPMLVVFIEEQLNLDTSTQGEQGVLAFFGISPQSRIAAAINSIEKLNDEHMSLLLYIENSLHADSRKSSSQFVADFKRDYPSLARLSKQISAVYFQRYLSNGNALSADDAIAFARNGDATLSDSDIFERVKFLGDSARPSSHELLLKLAQHYHAAENPSLAEKYLELIPPESPHYSEALRLSFGVLNDLLSRSHDEPEATASLLKSIEQSLGLLILRKDSPFGPSSPNLAAVAQCMQFLIAQKKGEHQVAGTILRMFRTLLDSTGIQGVDKTLVQSFVNDILNNTAYTKFHAPLLDMVLNDAELNGQAWINRAALKGYASELLTSSDIPSAGSPLLLQQLNILFSLPASEPGLWEAIEGRYKKLSAHAKYDGEMILSMMTLMLKLDTLSEPQSQFLTDILPHYIVAENNRDSFINTAIALAKKHPAIGAEILLKAIHALPEATQKAMVANDDATYREIKPLRDALLSLPNGETKKALITTYPVLAKKTAAARVTLKVGEAGRETAEAVMRAAQSRSGSPSSHGKRATSPVQSVSGSSDNGLEEFELVDSSRGVTPPSPTLSDATVQFANNYARQFDTQVRAIADRSLSGHATIREKLEAANGKLQAYQELRIALEQVRKIPANKSDIAAPRAGLIKKHYLGLAYAGPETDDDKTELSERIDTLDSMLQDLEMQACASQCLAIQEYYASKLSHWGQQYEMASGSQDQGGMQEAETHFEDNQIRARNTHALFTALQELANIKDKNTAEYRLAEMGFRTTFLQWKESNLNKQSSPSYSTRTAFDLFRKRASQAIDSVAKHSPVKILQSDHAYYQDTLSCENLIEMSKNTEGKKTIDATCAKLSEFSQAKINNTSIFRGFLETAKGMLARGNRPSQRR